MLESTSDNLSKFRTRNWVEKNDESRGKYANSVIGFKTTMLRSNLCDYADSYILVKGTITITGEGADGAAERADERDKGVTFKNCAPFTKCISRITNRDIDNAHDIDIVMPMYNLIEYSDNYSKTSGSGAVVEWLSLLHNFIQLSLNSGSAQFQTLLAACQRFTMVRISDNGPGWK